MGKEIIIHAGYPKTATTSIQQYLYVNRDFILSEYKILYPSIAVCHTNFIKLLFTDNVKLHYQRGEVELKYDLENKQACIEGVLDRFDKEFKSQVWEKCIISSEYVSSLTHQELERLLVWCKKYADSIKLVIYTRDPIKFTASATQQYIKGGLTLNQILNTLPVPNFKQTLSRLRKHFAQEDFKVIEFESAIRDFDHILDSFFYTMEVKGLKFAALPNESEFTNESMSMQAAYIWSRINGINKNVDKQNAVLEITGRLHRLLRSIPGEKFRLPAVVEKKIYEETVIDNKWLRDEYGIDYLVDMLPKNLEIGDSDENIFNTDKTLNRVSRILYNVLLENQKLNSKK